MISTHERYDTVLAATKKDARVRMGLVDSSLALKMMKCRKKGIKKDLQLALFIADKAINYLSDSDALSTIVLHIAWIFSDPSIPDTAKRTTEFINSWLYEALTLVRSREKAMGRKISREVINFDIPARELLN